MSPDDAAPSGWPRARRCGSCPGAGRSWRRCASTPAAARAGVHDPPLPRRGRHEPAHDRGQRPPKSGTAEFKATAVRLEKLAARHGCGAVRMASAADGRRPIGCGARCAVGRGGRIGPWTRASAAASPTKAASTGRPPRRHRRRRRPTTCCCRRCTPSTTRRLDLARRGSTRSCRRLQVAPAEAFGVASFYDLFAFEPRPAHRTLVCVDLACRIAVGGDVPVGPGQDASPCLGPVRAGPAPPSSWAPARRPARRHGIRRASRAAARATPRSCSCARVGRRRSRLARGLPGPRRRRRRCARASSSVPPASIAELEASKLAGRGGAAFPAGRKWAAVAAPARPPARAGRPTRTRASRARSRTAC